MTLPWLSSKMGRCLGPGSLIWVVPVNIPATMGSTAPPTPRSRGRDYLRVATPWLNSTFDVLDDEGYVHLPRGLGLGQDINFDYIRANAV